MKIKQIDKSSAVRLISATLLSGRARLPQILVLKPLPYIKLYMGLEK